MRERRSVTLLELAIAASVAVVPLLLVVLVVVSEMQPVDRAGGARRNGDRHVSLAQVAALKTFEQAIVRRDTVTAALPSPEALQDGVPQCRSEWDGRGGALSRMRKLLARSDAAAVSPAQRMAAQLEELDAALLRFSTRANRRVGDTVGFDAARWFDAVRAALQLPVETPEYPGRKFMVQCSDLAAAVATLARADGRMLGALAWRGTVVDKAMANWRPGQYVEISARQLARGNPWAGLPGCVYMGFSAPTRDLAVPAYFVAGPRSAAARVCSQPDMLGVAAAERSGASDAASEAASQAPVGIAGEATADMPADDARWGVPPSLAVMLQPLSTLQRPTGSLYRMYTEAPPATDASPTGYRYGPNRIAVGGTPIDVGFSIDLTIEPAVQAWAQRTAACYTGRQDICRALGLGRSEDGTLAIGHRMLERAMVRMAAIAVIDVASGRIEALAGALSPCARQEYDGPGRAASCDRRLPYPIRYRPDALQNPAVYHDAMPASVVKPIMAAAFLSDRDVGARWLAAEQAAMLRPGTPAQDSLRGQLMRSNSARFLDRMFCADKAFMHCRRPWEVQAMAGAFGWNGGCDDARADCGKRDLLFGRAVDASDDSGAVSPLAAIVAYGRLLAEPVGDKPGAPFRLRRAAPLDAAKLRQCAAGADGARASGDDWGKCRGSVVDVVAEGWGQGQARSSALGVAGMMAALAAAANGQVEVRRPHLVAGLHGAGFAPAARLQPAAMRFGLAAPEPNRIARDAAEVVLSGLSYSHRAGTARLACEQVFDARTCRDMDWIAGKTGTPTFPNDDRSLGELARLCAGGAGGAGAARSDRSACGPLRPYKWYVAAYRSDPDDTRWTKAIGVLTERNWIAATGRIHGAGDHGPNPAAEIAMQIAARHAGRLQGDVR